MSFNPNVCPFPTSGRKVFVSHTKLERILCFTFTLVLMWIIICCIQVCWGVHWGAHCACGFFLRISNGKGKWRKRRDSGGPAGGHYVHNVGAAELQLYKHYSILYNVYYYRRQNSLLVCLLGIEWGSGGMLVLGISWGKGLVQYGIVVHTRLWCSRP